jgi:hypothetical protein
MRILVTATLLVFSASLALCQDLGNVNLCNAASVATVGHADGVIVQEVVLSGKWGSNKATAYLPDKEIADGGIVFSHSEIHSQTGASMNLLAFALTLAQAGAAVIVPHRTLLWPAADEWMNREGGIVICAEHWLIDHAKVFNNGAGTVQPKNDEKVLIREGYAYVGPELCNPSETSYCEHKMPFLFDDCGYTRYCRTAVVQVKIGETDSADRTNQILSAGGLSEAQWLQRHLGLLPIGSLQKSHPASGS